MEFWNDLAGTEEYVIGCRRWLHEHAELSDYEEETVAFIIEQLQASGVEYVNVPKGGVLGFIHGAKPGKTILLRADIDALPMQEDPCNAKQPKVCVSKNPGVAHTCGHDTHAAMLLASARILQKHQQDFNGSVVLYFERGEEGGHGDYYLMQYILEHNIHIDGCWAIHNKVAIPTGTIALSPGPIYAGSTTWNTVIQGENALACAVSIINSINTARMRGVSPYETCTLANTRMQFGTDKVAPGSCQISGNCRYYDMDAVGRPMRDIIYETVKYNCEVYDCTTEAPLRKRNMSRPCINNPACVRIAKEALSAVIGQENLLEQDQAMGHESYSILAAYYPSIMCGLGARNEEKGMTVGAHNPRFEPDEACLKIGVAATLAYTQAFLTYKQPIPFRPFTGSVEEFFHPV
ncbi:MAG: amidohydrolase [Oscillospiraceae bacterium]|nr:amidohydrolase [Oscillospiraceae bacterium]